MLKIKDIVVSMISASIFMLGASMASGQDYPNKPIRIVTGGLGGGLDFAARLIAPGLTSSLGQPVIVDNRAGVPAGIVTKAPPDGYTLLLQGSSFWIAPLLEQKVSYDPVSDFSPITITTSNPTILVVHPSLPVKSVKELIALAKAKPGELNYAAGNIGGIAHLAGETFKSMAGVNIVRISYKSTTTQMSDLFGGQVQMTFDSLTALGPHIKSGKLRALAVTSAKPFALAPDLPTIAASGLPGYEFTNMIVMFAPAKTPDAIIKRLNQEIVRFLSTAEAKERFFNAGIEAVGSSPQELAATMKSEIVKAGKVIKDVGVKAE